MKKVLIIISTLIVGISVFAKSEEEIEKAQFKSCIAGVYLNQSVKVYGKWLSDCKYGEVTHITPDGRLIDQILCFVPMKDMNNYVNMYYDKNNLSKHSEKFIKKHQKYCHGDALEIVR